MQILFLDESGDHNLTKIDSTYPAFCLAGMIISEEDYEDELSPNIDSLKLKYWKTTDVILHSRDIRKCLPPFNILMNKDTKGRFYEDIDNIFLNAPVTLLASIILKEKLNHTYATPMNPYEISLLFIMERFLYHLEEIDEVGYISVESRDKKMNASLLESYTKIISYGSGAQYRVVPSRYQSRIRKLEFVTKAENENGHQIADLIAYPTTNKILYPNRTNPSFEIIKQKFRKSPGGRIKGYGIKVFP